MRHICTGIYTIGRKMAVQIGPFTSVHGMIIFTTVIPWCPIDHICQSPTVYKQMLIYTDVEKKGKNERNEDIRPSFLHTRPCVRCSDQRKYEGINWARCEKWALTVSGDKYESRVEKVDLTGAMFARVARQIGNCDQMACGTWLEWLGAIASRLLVHETPTIIIYIGNWAR